jgi:hypothetical protein
MWGKANGAKRRWLSGRVLAGGLAAGMTGLPLIVAAVAFGGSLQGCGGCHSGTITVSWGFNAGSNGCQPGDKVAVRVDNNDMVVYPDCTDYSATTPSVGPGTHVLDLTLFDGGGALVEQGQPLNVDVCGSISTPTYYFSS